MTSRIASLCSAAAVLTISLVLSGCLSEESNGVSSTPLETPEAASEDTSSSTTPSLTTNPSEISGETATVPDSLTVKLGQGDLLTGIPGEGALTIDQIQAWVDDPVNHVELDVELPLGLNVAKVPPGVLEANPLTKAKIELGRQLYFDTRLSSDNTISCASCHAPEKGYAFDSQFGIGVDGQQGGRNSPVSYNRILSTLQFWDGRADSLEEQAVGPIANPIEMANTHENAVSSLKDIAGYVVQFEAVFEDGVTIDNVGKAIASFERAVVTGPSAFDYYEQLKPFDQFDKEDIADDPDLKAKYDMLTAGANEKPMSDSAKRGHKLFFSERVNCAACHVGANLADEKYHNLGIGMDAEKPDLGRYEVTKDEKDKGAFKTPTIRNVALSAPYMHDGSLKTLEDTVEHYNKGGTPNEWLSDKVKKLNLTNEEKKDLVAFMEACTGDFPKVETARLPE